MIGLPNGKLKRKTLLPRIKRVFLCQPLISLIQQAIEPIQELETFPANQDNGPMSAQAKDFIQTEHGTALAVHLYWLATPLGFG